MATDVLPPSFADLAREYEIHPSDVAALVIGGGARFRDAYNAKVVDPDDLPKIRPMLARLSSHKRRSRKSKAPAR